MHFLHSMCCTKEVWNIAQVKTGFSKRSVGRLNRNIISSTILCSALLLLNSRVLVNRVMFLIRTNLMQSCVVFNAHNIKYTDFNTPFI
jgi:hypothetical protein